jgi:PleD family two-component response regulator
VMMGASTLEGLIEQADQALYKSKENGRNQVTLWVPEVADATA